ncbi:hypothetical protein [Kitasatospora sp. NPDC004272]
MSSTGPEVWAAGLSWTGLLGARSVQTPALALMSVDEHTVPGVPVDLVDVSAFPLRYALGLPTAPADDGGR